MATSNKSTTRNPAPTVFEELAFLLEDQAKAITKRWHARLSGALRLRPGNIFPGRNLLDGMPQVVKWLAQTLRNGNGPGSRSVESLRKVAEHWRSCGFSVEESLLHFRFLSDVLFEDFEEMISGGEVVVTPSQTTQACARLCRSIDLAQVVLVASYRDAEEERFAAFGATLAHEVRNHLGAALVAIQAVRAPRDGEAISMGSDRARELLGHAESGLEAASHLVDSVEAMSGAEQGRGDDWEMVPLPHLVQTIVRNVQDRGNHDVRLEVDDGFPDVCVPKSPVSLILHNLLENAVRYADPEKSECWVRVQGRRAEDGHLVVQVGDNGLGIPEPEQERVFMRFHRGSHARGEGFGLGLAIALQAGRLIGSRLMLESQPGEGSTFGFTIPVESQQRT